MALQRGVREADTPAGPEGSDPRAGGDVRSSRVHTAWAILRRGAGLWIPVTALLLLSLPAFASEEIAESVPEGIEFLEPLPEHASRVSDPVRATLGHAWRTGDADLLARVERSQVAGARLGLRDLEPHARLALHQPGATDLARAEAAVSLAPGWPAGHFALARAQLADLSPLGAARSLADGVRATRHHVGARLWAGPALFSVLAATFVLSGIAFLVLATASAGGGLVRALGSLPGDLPAPSRLALIGCVLLAPLALGEGLLGLGFALLALGLVAPGWGRRAAVALAGGLVLIGMFPLLDAAARSLVLGRADPVALAAVDTQRGLADLATYSRLAAADASRPAGRAGGLGPDLLVREALGLRAHREGRHDEALVLMEPLLRAKDPRQLTHAANVKLAAREPEAAIALYEAASRSSDSPVIRVNLSQAYGSVVRLDQQDLALAEAQALGADDVRDRAEVLSRAPAATTFDLPADWTAVAARLDARAEPDTAEGLAAALRERLAPGLLGKAAPEAGAGWLAAIAAGLALAFLLGRLGHGLESDFYGGMAELLVAGGGEGARRADRLARLRARQARSERLRLGLSWVVPGAAGLLGRHALLGLLATTFAGAAVAMLGFARGPLDDGGALGPGVGLLAATGAALATALYLSTTAIAVWLRERS